RDLGFDPAAPAGDVESQQGTNLDLHACPLTVRGTRPHPFICAVHEGYLDYQTDTHIAPHLRLTLQPLSRPGVCSINLRSQPQPPAEEESPLKPLDYCASDSQTLGFSSLKA